MNNLKIYKILLRLDIYQRNRFAKFLKSPYFNQKSVLVYLYEYIDTHIRSESQENVSKKEMWTAIKSEINYKEKNVRKQCSDLNQLLQTFLSVENFLAAPLQVTNNLLEGIHSEDIQELQTSTLSKAERLSERRLDKSADYYYQQYRLQRNIYNIVNYKLKRREDSNISNIINNLDNFYLTEKFKNHCNLLIRKNYSAQSYQDDLFIELVNFVEKNNFDAIPSISVYFNMYKLISTPDIIHYDKLKKLVDLHIDIFPEEEALDLYHVMINFCVAKVNTGNELFYREMFDVYKDGLNNGKLLYQDELEPWDFKNIVVLALRLKEFEWTRKFIQNYHLKLNPQFQKNAYAFNMARLYLYLKNYEEVKIHLSEVVFDDFSYKLSAKAMMIPTFYELKEFEPLKSFLKSFYIFIMRSKNKIPPQKVEMYINLISFTQKLVDRSNLSTKSLSDLYQLISKTENTANLEWLLEKIDELEKELSSSGKRKTA